MESQWKYKIFTFNEQDFEPLALDIFQLQYNSNPVYHDYVNALQVNPAAVRSIAQIPFLPIRFFKSHSIQTTTFDPEIVFESSGTTGNINSRHFVKDISIYKKSFTAGFEFAYGPVKDWCIIGLLPSYAERGNSSLVYMVNDLVKESGHPQSGFYLNEYEKLLVALVKLEKAKQKTLLIGVTFALLDFAEKHSFSPEHTIIMETGGMKGRRKPARLSRSGGEMIRQEVHDILQRSFSLPVIHSEYGMTELLSQAYSKGKGIFCCPPWMRVLIRDDEDPLFVTVPRFQTVAPITGAINVIDLANIYSCSFIATDDAGRLYNDGSFEVLGRIDNSDVRGCSLMVL